MNIRQLTITLAVFFFSGNVFQQAIAQPSDSSAQFNSTVFLGGRIQAGRGSILRLGSTHLLNSRPGSSLTMHNRVRISGPITLKKNARFQAGSLSMKNGYVGGSTNFDTHVDFNGSATVEEGGELGMGGAEIVAGRNYDPEVSNQMNSMLFSRPARNTGLVNNPTYPVAGNSLRKHPLRPVKNIQSPPVYMPGTIWDNNKAVGGLERAERWIASAAYAAGMSRKDRELYDRAYQKSVNLYYTMERYRKLANKALKKGNIAEYEKYKKLYYQTSQEYGRTNIQLANLHDRNFEQPMQVSKAVYELSKYSAEILAKATGHPVIDKAVDGLYKGLDYAMNSAEFGSEEAKKRLMADIIKDVLFEAPLFDGKSLSHAVEKATGPLVGQSGVYQDLSKMLSNPKTRAEIMRGTHAIIKKHIKDTIMQPVDETAIDGITERFMASLSKRPISTFSPGR